MRTFELRVSERYAIVYRIEADTEAEAREAFECGDLGDADAEECTSCELETVAEVVQDPAAPWLWHEKESKP